MIFWTRFLPRSAGYSSADTGIWTPSSPLHSSLASLRARSHPCAPHSEKLVSQFSYVVSLCENAQTFWFTLDNYSAVPKPVVWTVKFTVWLLGFGFDFRFSVKSAFVIKRKFRNVSKRLCNILHMIAFRYFFEKNWRFFLTIHALRNTMIWNQREWLQSRQRL